MTDTAKLEAFLAEPRNVVVVGVRADGRPHASPNWFHWDGEAFYVSTTRTRVKYSLFRANPTATLVVDDSTGFRCVTVGARAEVREDVAAELDRFRAIRAKHGVATPPDEEFTASLEAEQRVLLVFRPDRPVASWTAWGLD